MNRIEELTALLERITPGEWEVDGIGIDVGPKEVCLTGWPAEHPGDTSTPFENSEANARFIAAAPTIVRDMLEVVKAAQAYLVTHPNQHHNAGADALRKALEVFK